MLTIKVKKQFKKDLKKALLDPKRNTDLLKKLIDEHLIHTGTVPVEYQPHQVIGSLIWNVIYSLIFY
ncbi:MAG TPA: hypothetical protein PKC44_17085 [Agitococcus sp.]|nr:hypothetical protein [Agitococcus sp.]